VIVNAIERGISAVDYVNDRVNDNDPVGERGDLCGYARLAAGTRVPVLRRQNPALRSEVCEEA